MSSIDEIIQIYKRDVDVTLLIASLKKTPEQRIQAIEEAGRFREEMMAAAKRSRDTIR